LQKYDEGLEYLDTQQRSTNRYLCCMYIKGYCWIMRRAASYAGYGALHLNKGYVLEPFKNFFSFHFHE